MTRANNAVALTGHENLPYHHRVRRFKREEKAFETKQGWDGKPVRKRVPHR
jgi:hypothetical protein